MDENFERWLEFHDEHAVKLSFFQTCADRVREIDRLTKIFERSEEEEDDVEELARDAIHITYLCFMGCVDLLSVGHQVPHDMKYNFVELGKDLADIIGILSQSNLDLMKIINYRTQLGSWLETFGITGFHSIEDAYDDAIVRRTMKAERAENQSKKSKKRVEQPVAEYDNQRRQTDGPSAYRAQWKKGHQREDPVISRTKDSGQPATEYENSRKQLYGTSSSSAQGWKKEDPARSRTKDAENPSIEYDDRQRQIAGPSTYNTQGWRKEHQREEPARSRIQAWSQNNTMGENPWGEDAETVCGDDDEQADSANHDPRAPRRGGKATEPTTPPRPGKMNRRMNRTMDDYVDAPEQGHPQWFPQKGPSRNAQQGFHSDSPRMQERTQSDPNGYPNEYPNGYPQYPAMAPPEPYPYPPHMPYGYNPSTYHLAPSPHPANRRVEWLAALTSSLIPRPSPYGAAPTHVTTTIDNCFNKYVDYESDDDNVRPKPKSRKTRE